MWVKIAVIGMLTAACASLLMAASQLVRKQNDPKRLAQALAWRIGLSLVLFLFLMIGYTLGWWHPHHLG